MGEIYTRVVANLPLNIRGLTVIDLNGDYNIYINAKLSRDEQSKAFYHELSHIQKGHFYSEQHIDCLEKEAQSFQNKSKYNI